MNLRSVLNFNDGYYIINREERNLAAILYHVLLIGDNINLFLKALNVNYPIIEEEAGIYFEYAYIRDLWNSIRKGNDFKRKIILDLLKPINRDELELMSIQDFNRYYGAIRTPSTDYIASPGNWSMRYYDMNIQDNDEFLKVCKFKWCFNAKPDMVIHTTNNTAVALKLNTKAGRGSILEMSWRKEYFIEEDLIRLDSYLSKRRLWRICWVSGLNLFSWFRKPQ